MKNLTKITILVSILTVFGISCQNTNNPQKAEYEIQNEIPNTLPPTHPQDKEDLPTDLTVSKEVFSFEITQGNHGYTDTFYIRKGVQIQSYNIVAAVPSIDNNTKNTNNEQDILSSIKVNASTIKDMYVLTVKNTMHNALGVNGSATIKVKLHISGKDDSEKEYIGTRELTVIVRRIN